MLYCTVHKTLYVDAIQQWIHFPETQLANLHEVIIEGTCDQCVSAVKESLKFQFPELYTLCSSV